MIASHNAASVIAQCLEALVAQADPARAEVIVADSSDDGTDAIVAERFPQVRLLHFDAPLTVPELRGRGIAVAKGGVIAILDPFSMAAPDWVAATLAAHQRAPNLVIGGSVDKHPASGPGLLAWTLYFNEYGLFLPPIAAGAAGIVPGSNVSYKRAHLFDGEVPRHAVFWKTFVNWEAEAQGSPLWLDPNVRVSLNKPIPFGDYLRTRFVHGRCFAAMRVAGMGRSTRWLRAASTLAVPSLLCLRWTRGIWPKRRHRAMYALTLPLQFALFAVWSAGELWGYLRGGGNACRRLFY